MNWGSKMFSPCVGGGTFALAAAVMLGLLLPVSAQTPTQAGVPLGETVSGTVHISTAADGTWTAVTVAEQPGKPLSAAFVVQYQNPPSTLVAYRGTASVTLEQASLAVSSVDEGWLFKFPSYSRPLPAGRMALDVIGIATYAWPEETERLQPSSHEEFVTAFLKPPVCPSDCQCGGSGAQSCSCGGCSVSCYAPYAACCNGVGHCWCCQDGGERPSCPNRD